jgi:hypothetical protein
VLRAGGLAGLIVALWSCGPAPRQVLLLPQDPGNPSALLAVSVPGASARFFAVDLTAPEALTVEIEADQGTAFALLYPQPLAALGLAPGQLLSSGGGDPVPPPAVTLVAALSRDAAPSWTTSTGVPAVFEGLRLPPSSRRCRPIVATTTKLRGFETDEIALLEPRGPDLVWFATRSGRVASLGAEGIRELSVEDGAVLTAMTQGTSSLAFYVADTGGRLGVVTSSPAAQSITVRWDQGQLPEAGTIRHYRTTGVGQSAVLTQEGGLWVQLGTEWTKLYQFPEPFLFPDALTFRGTTLEVAAVRSPARYLVEATPGPSGRFEVRTTTVSQWGLTAVTQLVLEGTTLQLIGDRTGVIWQRSPGGAWLVEAETGILDPILDLHVARDRLIYIGSDGWAGSIVPKTGLCRHGPIMSCTTHAATLGGRRLYLGAGEVAWLVAEE